MVVMVVPGLGHITAVSVIAVAVPAIAALEVHIALEVDIPAGSLLLGDTVLHDPPVCRHLATHPAPCRPSFVSKLVPSLIDPAVGGEGRGVERKYKIVTNWMVSFG